MSVAAVLLARDESDIIEAVVGHLLRHVDEVIVADNRSADGTREILERLPVTLQDDPEIGYFQDRKTTALAMQALEKGHKWVIPCDADEIWHCGDPTLRIGDWLAGLAPDVMKVRAPIWNHIPSAKDPARERNPVKRIGYRKRFENGSKTCGRLRPDMWIEMGNHDIRTSGTALAIGGLNVRHFSWRSEEQMVRKVRNGIEAYNAAEGIGDQYGVGWRQYDGRPDDAIRSDFQSWFFSRRPDEDDELIYDPAPLASTAPPGRNARFAS